MQKRVNNPKGHVATLKPRWKQGESGNPAGRPKRNRELTLYISEKTDEGRALVDQLCEMAVSSKVNARDRIRAIEMLLDRGFGKAVQPIEVGGEVSVHRDISGFSDVELMELVDLRRRVREGDGVVVEGQATII